MSFKETVEWEGSGEAFTVLDAAFAVPQPLIDLFGFEVAQIAAYHVDLGLVPILILFELRE